MKSMGLLAHSNDFPNVHKNVKSHTEKDRKCTLSTKGVLRQFGAGLEPFQPLHIIVVITSQ